MDTLNSNPEAAGEQTPTPAAVPEAAVAPAPAPAPAPAAPAAPPAFRGVVPNTSAKTVGGWNRFAGYDPKAAKAKQNNNRGGSRGGR